MQIIKHGMIFRFDCVCCGCKYDAGEKELCEKAPYQCRCPECGTLNEGIKLEQKDNQLKWRPNEDLPPNGYLNRMIANRMKE